MRIGSNVSQLTNDAGYVTNTNLFSKLRLDTDNVVIVASNIGGSYSRYTGTELCLVTVNGIVGFNMNSGTISVNVNGVTLGQIIESGHHSHGGGTVSVVIGKGDVLSTTCGGSCRYTIIKIPYKIDN